MSVLQIVHHEQIHEQDHPTSNKKQAHQALSPNFQAYSPVDTTQVSSTEEAFLQLTWLVKYFAVQHWMETFAPLNQQTH